MVTRFFLSVSTLLLLFGCQQKSNLRVSLLEIEQHSNADTVSFNDTLLIRKPGNDKTLYLLKKNRELGFIITHEEYESRFKIKMDHIPKTLDSSFYLGYGETIFTNSCISCHNPINTDFEKWTEIGEREKPLVLTQNNINYYVVKKNAFHWTFFLQDEYTKESLKKFLKEAKGSASD